jgi:hypothetical protein
VYDEKYEEMECGGVNSHQISIEPQSTKRKMMCVLLCLYLIALLPPFVAASIPKEGQKEINKTVERLVAPLV